MSAVGGRLGGRRVVITGGASGIGEATTRLFAAEGASIAVLDHDAAGLERIAAVLDAVAVPADISNEDSVNAAMQQAARALGGLDTVVNAAGIATRMTAEHTSLDLWQSMMDVNLTGTFLVCRAAIPYLRSGRDPAIVNIASASGLLPSPAGAAYGVSKAGVDMLTKYLARELAPTVRVNAICPGMVETPMLTALLGNEDPAAVAATIKASYALQRTARPQEIAKAILFLASPESSYVTGISLAVDGGRTFH